MRKYFIVILIVLMASWASAEIICYDGFNYPDGPINGQAGGTGWDWDNTLSTHTNATSIWTNGPTIMGGALVTSNNNSRRTYGGVDDAGYRLAAFQGAGAVYCGVKMTPQVQQNWLGASTYDFTNERVFFGMPNTNAGLGNFGVQIKGGATVRCDIPVNMGQEYYLICVVDFDGDQVRMWIDPSADDWDNGAGDNSADVQIEYTDTYWSTSFRLASGGQTHWDDIKIATAFADLVPRAALHPSPENGQENIPLSVTLSWDPARDQEDYSQPDPDIVTHKLYGSFNNEPGDPNLYYVDEITNTGERASFGPLTLVRDTTYYWRVDEVLSDANMITGTTWSFESLPSNPIVDSSLPMDQLVSVGDTAQFSAQGTNPFEGHEDAIAYRWYAVSSGAQLAEGAKFQGVDSATLSVLDVQYGDEDSFFCGVTNTYGNSATVFTGSARLIVKRMMHHWPLDVDPNDIVGDLDGTLVGEPVLAEGMIGNAYEFAPLEYIQLPVFDRPDYFTVTAWAKTAGANDRHIWAWTNDINETTYTNQRAMLFRIQNGYVQYGENGISPVGWLSVTGAGGLNNGEYQFVAITYDKGEVKLYSNGLQSGSGSTADSLPMAATQLSIGNMGDRSPSANTINGSIDDVRFFNYALDRYEIAELYLDVVGGSVCMDGYPTYDFNLDCVVDLEDMASFISEWLLDNRFSLQN